MSLLQHLSCLLTLLLITVCGGWTLWVFWTNSLELAKHKQNLESITSIVTYSNTNSSRLQVQPIRLPYYFHHKTSQEFLNDQIDTLARVHRYCEANGLSSPIDPYVYSHDASRRFLLCRNHKAGDIYCSFI